MAKFSKNIHIVNQGQKINIHNKTDEDTNNNISQMAHQGHPGISNTVYKISGKYHWKGLKENVTRRSLSQKYQCFFYLALFSM